MSFYLIQSRPSNLIDVFSFKKNNKPNAPRQLTDPKVNFASVHGLTPVTVHMSFSLPEQTSRDGLPVVQHRVTRLTEVTFLCVNRTQKLPGARVVLRMLIINVWNKFSNKTFQKAPETGKRV